jgi:hypothetical protein
VRCADVRLVDMRQQRCGEDGCGVTQKPFRGICLLAAVQQLLDLRAQVRVGAGLLEERGALALGSLERIGRNALHLVPAFDISHAGAPGRASPAR